MIRCAISAIKVPYKKFSQRNYFYGLPVLFSRRKKKDPFAILHKIRDRKDPSSHVYKRFFSTSRPRSLPREVVCVTHDEVPLKRLNWSTDKMSCKTLNGIVILDLIQFYTLKKYGGIVQNKKDSRKQ